MRIYRIGESLMDTSIEQVRDAAPYVAVLTRQEWEENKSDFELGIDDEEEMDDMSVTKALVNYDSMIGTFSVPVRDDICGPDKHFAFALDEKGLVLIDDEGTAQELIGRLSAKKKWRAPSLERFLYDFLEEIVMSDGTLLKSYDDRLAKLENGILGEMKNDPVPGINEVKNELLDLKAHYDQLIDLCQELEENENGFFKEENLRYFRLVKERLERLRDRVNSLREYSSQIRDLYETRIDVRQNRIMTYLTVVTSIFMPLSFIAGWYGMNFVHMPELRTVWGYPAVILVCAVIVAGCLLFIKNRHWLK